jgi:hypothetical protein
VSRGIPTEYITAIDSSRVKVEKRVSGGNSNVKVRVNKSLERRKSVYSSCKLLF